MNRHLISACWVLLFLFLVPAIATAYPISPKPLWSLTAEADLIVVAEVRGVEDLPRSEDSWVSAVARLRVIETLKGPRLKTVEVPYAASLVCPAPARYAEGETVVAFLERDHDDAMWRTVSLSYGTLYPADSDLEDVTTMVRAAVAIQGDEALSRNPENKRRWLVQAAALPGTRWHGLYELVPGGDRIRSFYDRSGRSGKLRVTEQDQAILATAFLEAPKVDHTVSMMLKLLEGYRDPQLDLAAVGFLEGLLALEKTPWWVPDLLWAVLARFGDPAPETRLKAIEVDPWDITPGQLRALWEEAKVQLDIPDVEPFEIAPEMRLPVGGSTPS